MLIHFLAPNDTSVWVNASKVAYVRAIFGGSGSIIAFSGSKDDYVTVADDPATAQGRIALALVGG